MADRATIIETALVNLIRAWESLPVGNHPANVVGKWLNTTMKASFNAARSALITKPTFNLADEARGWNAGLRAAIRVANEQRSSEEPIKAPLTNAAYDEACRDIAGELSKMLIKETPKQ